MDERAGHDGARADSHGRVDGPAFPVLPIDELPRTPHAHEFVGADHGGVPFSIILVDAPPGAGPRLHRHPYAEVFLVEAGRARFRLGDETVAVEGGHVVVAPPNVPHGFTNGGDGALRITAVHAAERFDTEWLAGADPEWATPTKGSAG